MEIAYFMELSQILHIRCSTVPFQAVHLLSSATISHVCVYIQ